MVSHHAAQNNDPSHRPTFKPLKKIEIHDSFVQNSSPIETKEWSTLKTKTDVQTVRDHPQTMSTTYAAHTLHTEPIKETIPKKKIQIVEPEQVFVEKVVLAPEESPSDIINDINLPEQHMHRDSKQRKVPTSQLGRLWHFGGLAAGLGIGTVSHIVKKAITGSNEGSIGNAPAIVNEANAKRLVNTLSRMRGAALKLGQMMSIQDDALIPPQLASILERVRYSADTMPTRQLEKMLETELGEDWKEKFSEFNVNPLAAASIGQVHKAILKSNGKEVAVKVQYPGVADSIESDVNNLVSLLNLTGMIPKGLYIEKSVSVAKEELKQETNYLIEASNQKKFKEILKSDSEYLVPAVIDEVSSRRVLTSEFMYGITIDAVKNLDQQTRNWVAEKLMKLCLKELFEYRFMQTDPNWSNFFYNAKMKKIVLLDFGACREFPLSFTDEYIRVVNAAAHKDRETVLDASTKMGFLTGEESKIMKDAHTDAVMIIGEPFAVDEPFDFKKQNMTSKIHSLIPIMVKHRLTPPPMESYSLHRKLAGAFLVCARLEANINCYKLFRSCYANYYRLHKK